MLLIHSDYFDVLENSVHVCISMPTPQHLGERGCGGNDVSSVPLRSLEARSGSQITGCQLGKTIGIENERSGYSPS
jgi:hypothetical protein